MSTGNGHPNGGGTAPGDGRPGESIFKAKPPEGHAKKVSEVRVSRTRCSPRARRKHGGELRVHKGHAAQTGPRMAFAGKLPRREQAMEGSLPAAIRGEVVWLMSQSALHKQFFISDLEWPACAARKTQGSMTPTLLQQFRMFYADDRPVGVLLWAFVSDEVEARLKQGITKLRPQDCPRGIEPNKVSGDKLWVLRQQASKDVEAIAPFGGAEEMVKDLKAKVFAARELRYVALGEGGRKDVRVV